MATLSMSQDCLADYGSLEKRLRKQVDDVFAKFTGDTHAGLHLEKLGGSRDPRVRTIRLGIAHRGIVMAPEDGDIYLLHRVLTHDEADKWVQRNVFSVNAATGAFEIRDVVAIEEFGQSALDDTTPEESIFSDRKDKDLTQLGIPEDLIRIVRKLGSEDELLAFVELLTERQAAALLLLADGKTVDETYWELLAGETPDEIDPEDLDAALRRPASRSQFFLTDNTDELREVLDQPFAAWRVFLHPSQRRLAYKEHYNGPVRVMGGPGTGKTVVAIHRAKALVDAAANTDDRILFTTFTRNLATAIEADLELLAGPEILERIDVLNIDRLAPQILTGAGVKIPPIMNDQDIDELFNGIVDELATPRPAGFVNQEWRQVVLAQNITSREQYLKAPRPGRGVRLNRRARSEVFKAIETLTDHLDQRGRTTYLQLADQAAELLADQTTRPYRHVIVDEAQDLHPAQWRLVRALVEEQPDDLFIVGDTHQRIYNSLTTFSRVGINIRGRSHRLRLNYRTTEEILRWSLGLIKGESFDDLDEGVETLDGYRSERQGPRPKMCGPATRQEQLGELAKVIEDWLAEGIEPATIGIATRTGTRRDSAAVALADLGVTTTKLGAVGDDETRTDIAIGTMHRLKGLEFRCMAVIDVEDGVVPLTAAVADEDEDPTEHALNTRRERCLLFVACTRARDHLWVGWNGKPSRFLEPLLST